MPINPLYTTESEHKTRAIGKRVSAGAQISMGAGVVVALSSQYSCMVPVSDAPRSLSHGGKHAVEKRNISDIWIGSNNKCRPYGETQSETR